MTLTKHTFLFTLGESRKIEHNRFFSLSLLKITEQWKIGKEKVLVICWWQNHVQTRWCAFLYGKNVLLNEYICLDSWRKRARERGNFSSLCAFLIRGIFFMLPNYCICVVYVILTQTHTHTLTTHLHTIHVKRTKRKVIVSININLCFCCLYLILLVFQHRFYRKKKKSFHCSITYQKSVTVFATTETVLHKEFIL